MEVALFPVSTPILAKKHVSTVLIFLLDKGTARKSEIVSVVPSNTTVDKLVLSLSKNGLIDVETGFKGRRFYSISLTEKGRTVAEQLKRADEVTKGVFEVIHQSRKFCTSCGTSNEVDAKYCKECGMKLESNRGA